jgi:hypothetical protein
MELHDWMKLLIAYGPTPHTAAAAVAEEYQGDPLVRSYVHRHMEAVRRQGRPESNSEGWCAVGEQRVAAFTVAAQMSGGIPTFSKRIPLDKARIMEPVLLALLLGAQPYLWKSDMMLVAKSAPMPRHVLSRGLLPFPAMFWSFEDAAPNSMGGVTDWMLIAEDSSDGSEGGFITFMPNTAHVGPNAATSIEINGYAYGKTFPDDFGKRADTVQMLLQMLALLASPHVELEEPSVPRPIRRDYVRQGRAQAYKLPHVVKLRRAALDAQRAHAEASSVAWQHQWWVSGHYRAQWMPSTQDHQVRWIAPYLKGPADKPILEKVYSVER